MRVESSTERCGRGGLIDNTRGKKKLVQCTYIYMYAFTRGESEPVERERRRKSKIWPV